MPIEIVLPRLGWNMAEGSLVEWVKQDGDEVRPGDVICLIEGDKAVTEVEALDGGMLRIPPDSPAPGQTVPVGTRLAYLLAPGEAVPFETAPEPAAGRPAAAGANGGRAAGAALTPALSQRERGTPASARGERGIPAPAQGERETSVLAHGERGTPARARRAPPPLPAGEGPGVRASPRARRVARELGVDWTRLTGSGITGRIRERDVRAAAAIGTAVERAPAAAMAPAGPAAEAAAPDTRHPAPDTRPPVAPGLSVQLAPPEPAGTRTPLSGVRRLIGLRMTESARTVAPVTLTTEADATELVRLRETIRRDLAGTAEPVPTYADLLGRLVALALTEHPALNASLDGDAIVQHEAVNLGFAVDTDRGLLVPVVRDCARRSIAAIAAESARLVEAARGGRIDPEDLRGGTFTITNLGMYEIDAFTPIVNLPECAVLGIGRIVARPVVVDEATDAVAVRRMLALSLTFDHRLVDGAPAARFLQRVKHFVERPALWLIR